ncbi:MAG: AAA family ATPase [Filifactoraceae bacterium]
MNEEICNKLKDFMAQSRIPQSAIAAQMGMSGSQLSLYLNDKYKGDVVATESKILEFLKTSNEREAFNSNLKFSQVSRFVETTVSMNAYKIIKYCQLKNAFGIIYGDAGIGKTKAAQKFIEDNPNSSLYIKVSPPTGSLRGILRQIAEELRISSYQRNDELALAVKKKLEESARVLVIDEAQHLTYKAMEWIRSLPDYDIVTNESAIAIVLIGNDTLYSRMMGGKNDLYAQQYSRFAMRGHFTTNNVTESDVRNLFPEVRDNKEVEYLYRIAKGSYGVRGAANVYSGAVDAGDISYEGLYKVAKQNGMGVI